MTFLSKMGNTSQRLAVSAVAIIIIILAVYYGNHPFLRYGFIGLAAAVIAMALLEYYHIAEQKAYRPNIKMGVSISLVYIMGVYLSTQSPYYTMLPPIILALGLLSLFLYYFRKGEDPYTNLAITSFGIIYLTIPLAMLVNIYYYFPGGSFQEGRWWLLYLILITKITDVGAFFIGKKFGQKRMVPYISPKKTWEGAAGGLIAALLTSVAFHILINHLFLRPPIAITYIQSLTLGALISLLAQLGDLAESLLKRDGGVKDSSNLPGLGGMLDVVDSLVFTCPLIYFYLKLNY